MSDPKSSGRPRVVVVGGYGVFGARAAERLAQSADLDVVIAGRNGVRAEAAALDLARVCSRPIGHATIDAAQVSSGELRAIGAQVVVNASGPFQAQNYTLARAAIGAGLHYVDIADARSFVTGIGVLDAQAREANVLVVSGASSVPGLSSAVLYHYAPRFARLTSVSHGISPADSFDPGEATVASILGAVGRPFMMRLGGRAQTVHGWQGLHRHRFAGIGRRWMGYCDVPDLDLFPLLHPELESVRFVAGVEVGLFHLGIWVLSWLVRLGIVRRIEPFAASLLALKRNFRFLGSDQGGMFMTLEGDGVDGRPLRIDWQLEASHGHGPYIPATAAVILAKKLARGQMDRRGAMPCTGLVTLADFRAEIADLDIRSGDMSMPLYRRVLQDRFDELPAQVRALHDVAAETRWIGRVSVERGRSVLANLVAAIAGLPPAGRDLALAVTMTPASGTKATGEEIWSRDFAGHVFASRQGEQGPMLWEQVGPSRLVLGLLTGPEGLSLEVQRLSVLGLPMPRWLLPRVATREWEEQGRYRFAVEASLPLVGALVSYAGWLERSP